MASSPPTARESAHPPPTRLIEAAFRADGAGDGVIFFCVEAAPHEACRTHSSPDGGLTFETHLKATVLEVLPGELRLADGDHRPVVRHLLPRAVDLSALRGHRVSIDIAQRYLGRGRATIDTELRDADDRLLLWAHDGRVPADQLGLAFRRTVDADGHRLAIGHAGGVSTVSAGELVRLRAGLDTFDLAIIRAGADDVSFVLMRR